MKTALLSSVACFFFAFTQIAAASAPAGIALRLTTASRVGELSSICEISGNQVNLSFSKGSTDVYLLSQGRYVSWTRAISDSAALSARLEQAARDLHEQTPIARRQLRTDEIRTYQAVLNPGRSSERRILLQDDFMRVRSEAANALIRFMEANCKL